MNADERGWPSASTDFRCSASNYQIMVFLTLSFNKFTWI